MTFEELRLLNRLALKALDCTPVMMEISYPINLQKERRRCIDRVWAVASAPGSVIATEVLNPDFLDAADTTRSQSYSPWRDGPVVDLNPGSWPRWHSLNKRGRMGQVRAS